MQETSLRWGLGMGVINAALGALALLLGTIFAPIPTTRTTSAEAVAIALFLRGIAVLLVLGVALALAYVAGFRAERALRREPRDPEDGPPSRREAVLAGAIAMLCYWIITSLYLYALGGVRQQGSFLAFMENRLVFGVVCVVLGAGMGGLGGRAVAARRLLEQVLASPAAQGAQVAPTAAPAQVAPAAPAEEVATAAPAAQAAPVHDEAPPTEARGA